MTRDQMLDQMNETAVTTGNGVFKIGEPSLAGIGDASLMDPAAGTWAGLGSLLGTSTAQITVTSAAMLGGRVYLSGLAADGTPTLYALPAAAASKLATIDVTAAAAVGTGGAATVADWRGDAASSLSMRAGDTATWTAVPSAGYTFSKWVDEGGATVSTDAAFSAVASASRTLTAQFEAVGQQRTFDNGVKATLSAGSSEDIETLVVEPRDEAGDEVAGALGDRTLQGDWDAHFTDGKTDGFGTLTLSFPATGDTVQVWEVHAGKLTIGADQAVEDGMASVPTTTLSEFAVTSAPSKASAASGTAAAVAAKSASSTATAKTGDAAVPIALGALALAAAAAGVAIAIRRRKRD